MPELDLLRLLAALAVMAFHYISSYIPAESRGHVLMAISGVTRYGYLGVSLFFIISGYVILWSAQGRSPSDFTISRISRLYPGFWTAMLLTAAAIVCLGPYAPGVSTSLVNTKTLAANATMMPQLFGVRRIDEVYWTLEFEIRFYFLVFALLFLRQMTAVENWLYAWLAVCLLSIWYPVPWALTYLSLMPYGPLFIAGCLFFIISSGGWTRTRGLALLATAALCAANAIAERSQFLQPDQLSAWVAPTVVLMFFLVFLLIIRRKGDRPPSPVAYRLGALTYPLYLTHATIGVLMINVLTASVGIKAAVLITTVLAFLLAQAIVMVVEERARKPMAKLCRIIVDRTMTTATRAWAGTFNRRPG